MTARATAIAAEPQCFVTVIAAAINVHVRQLGLLLCFAGGV